MESNQSSESNPHTYGHLIFDKDAKIIQWENKKTSSKNGADVTGCQHIEK